MVHVVEKTLKKNGKAAYSATKKWESDEPDPRGHFPIALPQLTSKSMRLDYGVLPEQGCASERFGVNGLSHINVVNWRYTHDTL